MEKNRIEGMDKVWNGDPCEFANCVRVVSRALGDRFDYEYICAVSGAAFRASFAKDGWNHGSYHISCCPIIIEHTFNMLGYKTKIFKKNSDYEHDKKLITDSIDNGKPVIIIEPFLPCAEVCVVVGYENHGDVMIVNCGENDYRGSEHRAEIEIEPDVFRISDWHKDCPGNIEIIIIEGKASKPDNEDIFAETMKIVKRLITDECLVSGQWNGSAALKAQANALQTYEWTDTFEPYMNTYFTHYQYRIRKHAVGFFKDNGRDDLAGIYAEIAALVEKMEQYVSMDFSGETADRLFFDKNNLKPYCDALLKMAVLEEKAASLI